MVGNSDVVVNGILAFEASSVLYSCLVYFAVGPLVFFVLPGLIRECHEPATRTRTLCCEVSGF